MTKRIEVSVLGTEKRSLAEEALKWAYARNFTHEARNPYMRQQVTNFLDGIDEDKSQDLRERDDAAIRKELEDQEQARLAGEPLPRPDVFGVIKRAPRVGETYERVEFRLSKTDHLRLRNYAWSQGITASAACRVILGLLDEEDLD